jgi:hypothetical protein
MANAVAGFNPTDVFTATTVTQGKGFGLGDRVAGHDGKEYVFLLAGGAITAQDVVSWLPGTFSATSITTANSKRGQPCGVANAAVASASYFWGQVYGATTLNGLTSCAANARINTTTTAGSLDDDATTGAKQIQGAVLSTAVGGGGAAAAACILLNPYVDVTL